MMQRTFGEIVGLDPEVPAQAHPADMLICHDTGEELQRTDCSFAADGTPFNDFDELHDYNVGLVKDILQGHIDWDTEYRKSDDCTDGYHHIVGEDSSTLMTNLIQWADDHIDSDSEDYPEEMREAVCEGILESMVCKVCEGYSTYDEPDVVVGSWECGETEVQIDIAGNDILQALAESDDLEGILGDLDHEFCISNTRKPVKVDGKVVRWEHDCFVSGDCFTLMNNLDYRYVFGMDNEALGELWNEHADKVDTRLYKVDGEFSAELFYDNDDDYDSEWICGKVAKRHKAKGAEFISHHDYPSESDLQHRELLNALRDIKDRAGQVSPTTPDSNTIIATWAEEALDDAELDFADRYPEVAE